MIRAFIALDLSSEIQDNLQLVIQTLKQKLPGAPVRWLPVQNIHITLKFLGDIAESDLGVLCSSLKNESSQHNAVQLQAHGLGAFDSLQKPRVIWVGVDSPPSLQHLQATIDAATVHIGYASEGKRFSPHLTLGRVARNTNAQQIRQLGEVLTQTEVGSLGSWLVQAVHLYRSDLSPQGASYTKLCSAGLRVKAAEGN